MLEIDKPLEEVIQESLASIPEPCSRDIHEWIYTYGIYGPIGWGQRISNCSTNGSTIRYPYYLCKHCHAVSENYSQQAYPKRVR